MIRHGSVAVVVHKRVRLLHVVCASHVVFIGAKADSLSEIKHDFAFFLVVELHKISEIFSSVYTLIVDRVKTASYHVPAGQVYSVGVHIGHFKFGQIKLDLLAVDLHTEILDVGEHHLLGFLINSRGHTSVGVTVLVVWIFPRQLKEFLVRGSRSLKICNLGRLKKKNTSFKLFHIIKSSESEIKTATKTRLIIEIPGG